MRSDTIRRVGRYNMQYYLAPMEGLTGYIYRNAHRAVFGGMDKYFTPFITPNHNRSLTSREMRDVQPEHNAPDVVPQIMANDAAAFIWAADKLAQLGYDEVNLNLGCPSRTVVTKGRGAGFLGRPTALDEFLAQVFDCVRIRVSIKARIGLSDCAELPGLMNIFNRYPICELTLHARVQSAYYKGVPDLYSYERAARMANMPLAYNGDVFSPADAADIEKRFPSTVAIMMGRGVLANPALGREIRGGAPASADELRTFHDMLIHGYIEDMNDKTNAILRMKELWSYMGAMFPDAEKPLKKLRKSKRPEDYFAAVDEVFEMAQ